MLAKLNNILMFVLIVIGVILMLLTMTSGLTPEDSKCTECWEVSYFVGFSYVLLIGAIVAALGGVIMNAVSNPKGIVGSLIGVGGMLVVIGISYALADDTILRSYPNSVTATAVKWTDAGLYTFYILFVISILSIVYTWVSKLTK